ncbi:hypothetical protein SEVIR_1G198500v4 [Setaria viridis]|uniref:Uncharacterized protein n=1 Tax=Setaria viridis TaxID=4556 RepID=A0A4U6WF28_SETVI|nr:hypothetical protein SEVIR_1G198500v2 [Setaria viridis]
MQKGVVLSRSRKYSKLFLSNKEAKECIALSESPNSRMKQSLVPGYDPMIQGRTPRGPKINNVQTVVRNKAIKRCKEVICWGLSMHRRGKSLNGQFSLNDLSYIGQLIVVM